MSCSPLLTFDRGFAKTNDCRDRKYSSAITQDDDTIADVIFVTWFIHVTGKWRVVLRRACAMNHPHRVSFFYLFPAAAWEVCSKLEWVLPSRLWNHRLSVCLFWSFLFPQPRRCTFSLVFFYFCFVCHRDMAATMRFTEKALTTTEAISWGERRKDKGWRVDHRR